jgi:hypothetical protein
MMDRGDLDQPFVRSKTPRGVRPGLFFQNIWEIPMVVAKTNSEWDL